MTIELTVYFLGEDVQLNTTVVVEEVSIVVYDGYFSSGGGGGAVDSVNGKTGVVVLNASDIAETSTLKWLTSTLKSAYDGAVSAIANIYTKTETDTLLSNKVDKISGKALSSNDFTNSDKSKLDSLSNYTGFRGAKATLAEIKTSYPTGTGGDWAIITNPNGNAYFAIYDPDIPDWIDAGQSMTIPGTNLSYSISGNSLTITSDTGTDVTIPLATGTTAGLMSLEDKAKIDSITAIFTSSLKSSYDGAVTGLTNKVDKTDVICLINKITSTYTVTGSTNETPFTSLRIPAGTFSAGDRVIPEALFAKTGSAGTVTSSFRISPSSSVSPITNATLMAKTPAAIAATTYYPLERKYIKIESATSTIMPPASGGYYNDSITFNSLPFTSLNIDWTVDQYIYVTGQLGNAADSIILKHFAIYKG